MHVQPRRHLVGMTLRVRSDPRRGGTFGTVSARSFMEEMHSAGYPVTVWSNGPGYTYRAHAHPYKKILYCPEGTVAFRFSDRDVTLSAGERMVVGPGVEHAATVGPAGVRCVEAHAGLRSAPDVRRGLPDRARPRRTRSAPVAGPVLHPRRRHPAPRQPRRDVRRQPP